MPPVKFHCSRCGCEFQKDRYLVREFSRSEYRDIGDVAQPFYETVGYLSAPCPRCFTDVVTSEEVYSQEAAEWIIHNKNILKRTTMINLFNRTDPNDELAEIIKEFNDAHQHLGHLTNQKYDTHTLRFSPINWSTCAEHWFSGDEKEHEYHAFLFLSDLFVRYEDKEWKILAGDELWGVTTKWMPLKKYLAVLEKIAAEWLEMYHSLPTHWDVNIYNDGKFRLESTVKSLYEQFFSTTSTEESQPYKDYISACIENAYFVAKGAYNSFELTDQTKISYWDKAYYLKNKDYIDLKLKAENEKNVELIRTHKAEEAAQKAFQDGMNSFIFSKQKDFDYTIDND